VPCGPILDIKDVIEDKALAERGMIVDVRHPRRSMFKTVGSPLVLSDSPVGVQASPLLGEHTAESLTVCSTMTEPQWTNSMRQE
jgi:formyl-CoA transferase